MAILKNGIHGPFSGRVGNIIGYELNGQQVIRSLPSYTKRKPTALAKINQNRMEVVSRFLSPLKQVINFGYKHVSPPGNRIGAFQCAQSHVFKEALGYGEENVPFVNPEAVLVFRGDLQPPQYIQAHRNTDNIQLTWDNQGSILRDMVLMLLAYNPEERFVIFDKGGAKASTGNYAWQLDERTLTHIPNLHIYAGFYNITRDELSDSVYVGCV